MTPPTDGEAVNNLRAELHPHYWAVRAGLISMADDYLVTGRALIRAKEDCRHGEWRDAFLPAFNLQPRTAERMMRAARAIDAGQVPAGLTITDTLKRIATSRPAAKASQLTLLPEVCRVHTHQSGTLPLAVCCWRCGLVVRATTGRPAPGAPRRFWRGLEYRLFVDGWRAVASWRGRVESWRNDPGRAELLAELEALLEAEQAATRAAVREAYRAGELQG